MTHRLRSTLRKAVKEQDQYCPPQRRCATQWWPAPRHPVTWGDDAEHPVEGPLEAPHWAPGHHPENQEGLLPLHGVLRHQAAHEEQWSHPHGRVPQGSLPDHPSGRQVHRRSKGKALEGANKGEGVSMYKGLQWSLSVRPSVCLCVHMEFPHGKKHQKQHHVPYYLSIVFLLSLKYAFGIISMFFTLVRCSIILLTLFLTYLHPCFLPYVQIYWISIRLLVSQEKCPIWLVLFILKFGIFAFFFILYCTLFEFIKVYSKCPKCHTRFFSFCLILLVSTAWKRLSCQVSHFFLTVPIP